VPLSDREYMRSSPPGRTYRVRGGSIFSLNPIWIIIGINFLLFIVTIVWGRGIIDIQGTRMLIYKAHYYLGLMPAEFFDRPWTIVTNLFVHGGFTHLLFNMLGLFFLGRMLITLIGSNKFLLVYFIGGILANFLFLLLELSSVIPVVGASGAVYAIAGALVILVPNTRVALWGIIPMPLWVFVVVFLVLLSLPPFVGTNVAWQAHLGGLLAGLITGYFFKRKQRHFIFV